MSTKQKIKQVLKDIPNKKGYVEFVTATLSIPIMFTVLTTNIMNLQKSSAKSDPPKTESAAPAAKEETVKIIPVVASDSMPAPEKTAASQSVTPTPQTLLAKASETTPSPSSCKKEVGPASISYPAENQTVSGSPLCIDVSQDSLYCSAILSYRLDGGAWSQYLDKSICLMNLSPGTHEIDVRVKSQVVSDEKLLQRMFIYAAPATPTPTLPPATPTPVASSSASL